VETILCEVYFENGVVYKESFYTDSYMKLFLNNICLRPSCHDCKFKSLNRLSDISLGDSWGIESINRIWMTIKERLLYLFIQRKEKII